jgi:hypothetical protein
VYVWCYYTVVQRLSRTSRHYPTLNPKSSRRLVLLSVRPLYYSQSTAYYLSTYFQIYIWQHSELASQQKLKLLLQKVQIPKRTDQYMDGSVKIFNCIILTSLCPSSLFSCMKFSTIDLYDSLVQSCSITNASCHRFPWFFPAGKDGPINSLLQIFPPKSKSSFF